MTDLVNQLQPSSNNINLTQHQLQQHTATTLHSSSSDTETENKKSRNPAGKTKNNQYHKAQKGDVKEKLTTVTKHYRKSPTTLMIAPKKIDMTPITTPVKRSITGSLETKGSRKPKKLILSPPDPLEKPELRSLRGTSFEDLYYEVYTQWKGNIPGDLSKEKGNTQHHTRASNIIDAMNWFRTQKEKEILKKSLQVMKN